MLMTQPAKPVMWLEISRKSVMFVNVCQDSVFKLTLALLVVLDVFSAMLLNVHHAMQINISLLNKEIKTVYAMLLIISLSTPKMNVFVKKDFTTTIMVHAQLAELDVLIVFQIQTALNVLIQLWKTLMEFVDAQVVNISTKHLFVPHVQILLTSVLPVFQGKNVLNVMPLLTDN